MRILYIGVDCGGTSLRAAAAGPSGTVLGELVVPTGDAQERENGLGQAIASLIADLVAEVAEEGDLVGGIGVGLPFVCWEGKAWLYRNVRALDPGRLEAELTARYGCPTLLENDVKCAALGESWLGVARGVDPFAYVNLGTGLSSAFFLGGRVYRGAHGAAGEIAFLSLGAGNDAGPGAFVPAVDRLGALEEAFSGVGLGAAYRRQSPGGEALDAQEIFHRAEAGEALARTVIDGGMDHLLPALANLATALDPSLLVLGGGIARGLGPWLPAIEAYIGRLTPFPPDVMLSGLGGRAGLLGAIRLAMGETNS